MNKKRRRKLVVTCGLLGLMLLGGAPASTNISNPFVITAQAAEATPTFSSYWYQDVDGTWKVKDNNGNIIKNAWLCDDAVTSNGKEVWYLLDSNGNMVTSGLVQDNTGNFYSLETSHNGYYGMLRYKSNTYDGIYLDLEASHNGSFAKIKNADGIEALKAKYGVTIFTVGNESCVYTSEFNSTGGGTGSTVSGGQSDNQQQTTGDWFINKAGDKLPAAVANLQMGDTIDIDGKRYLNDGYDTYCLGVIPDPGSIDTSRVIEWNE